MSTSLYHVKKMLYMVLLCYVEIGTFGKLAGVLIHVNISMIATASTLVTPEIYLPIAGSVIVGQIQKTPLFYQDSKTQTKQKLLKLS